MADLFGTYDKRIKLTIDHTEIDSDLAWFPVTVFLTDSQGEEVFTEFDADEDFDRIAFTSSDGETQLYADCELFDVSEQKAIYHVSKTGWTVSSSTDTDIYLYYDNTADHNTTYISKSGDTAAQSVWDSNFEAVYHMNDPAEPTYDTEYDGSVEPDSDGWTLGGSDYASSDGDILTIDTMANDDYTCYYYKSPDVDFDTGFYLKLRLKLDSSMGSGDYIELQIRDGTQNERAYVSWYHDYFENQTVRLYGASGYTNYTTNTSDDYHIYEIYVKGTSFSVYKDGSLLGTKTVDSGTYDDWVEFGDTTTNAAGKAYIDYLNYALDIGYNPAAGIVDATSNHNDGSKKASGEPVEATGKVGQGQDFDGSDDYIEVSDSASLDMTTAITIETIVNPDNLTSRRQVISKYDTDSSRYMQLRLNDGSTQETCFILGYNSGGNYEASISNEAISTSSHTYLVAKWGKSEDSGKLKIFYNTSEVSYDGTQATLTQDLTPNNKSMYIGSYTGSDHYMDGIIDETRISSTVRSAAWIGATYDSLWDTLLTYGSEETSGTTHSVSGSSDSVLSTSSSINITWDLSGSTDSVLSTSANLNIIFDIAGSSDSVLTTSSTIDLGVIEKLTGSSNSVLTTTALLKAIYDLSGSSDSTLETSAIIGAIRGLSGSSDSILDTLALLGFDSIKLTGSSDSVLSTLSTLNTILSLTGNSDSTLSTSSALNLIYSLSGSSNSSIDTSALLNAIWSLSGSSNSVLDTIATELIVVAVQKLTGSADSSISTLADLGIIKSFGGSADAVLDTIGIIEKYKKLLGTSSSTIATSATINALHRLLGNAQSSVDTSGNINLTWSLSGASSSVITTLGVLTPGIIEGLSGTVTCVIDTSGVLTRIRVWFPVDDVGGSWTNVDDTDGSWVQVSDTDGNWTQVRRPRW